MCIRDRYKRIENGNFRWPRTQEAALEISTDQYQMLMQGLEIVARHPIEVVSYTHLGAVIFHEDEFGQRLQRLKNFGIRSEEVIDSVGVNAKMNEFQVHKGKENGSLRKPDRDGTAIWSALSAWRAERRKKHCRCGSCFL